MPHLGQPMLPPVMRPGHCRRFEYTAYYDQCVDYSCLSLLAASHDAMRLGLPARLSTIVVTLPMLRRLDRTHLPCVFHCVHHESIDRAPPTLATSCFNRKKHH
ncbi:hypothetical protein HGRIS_005547 [Hohenbuehelia grisea]|uniref:Uncharacterized protein n=1 Tax=Hohenbuehelia grisea TaxID=104357 RepID=A0ABR3JY82_9AGAR